MTDQPTAQDRSPWLSVEAAAARLGVSPATIKRRIQDGKPVRVAGGGSVDLEVEMLDRPQGHEWRVRPRGALPPLSSDPERTDSEDAPPLSSDQDTSEALAALVEMTHRQSRQIDAQIETIAEHIEQERVLYDRIAALEREAGRAVSDATHAAEVARIERERRLAAEALAEARRLELERTRKRVESLERPFWRRWFSSGS